MPLDSNMLSELKAKLVAEKIRLENDLKRFAKPAGGEGNFETTFDIIGTDEDENASEVEEYADNLALEGTLESQLKDVYDALEKIEKGTYGICEKTGEDIPLERLRVYPAARTKVDA